MLHDALVSPEILALASPRRGWKPVGKRAGGRRTPQLRINARLIGLARAGHRVLRLKGGDPLVFGRGGEEAMALAAAGVPFRIVPGVSAGIGGTASAGIPLTHRALARSVAFATGHDATRRPAGRSTLRALARGADVLVLYMALRQIGRDRGSADRRRTLAGRTGRVRHRCDHGAPARPPRDAGARPARRRRPAAASADADRRRPGAGAAAVLAPLQQAAPMTAATMR